MFFPVPPAVIEKASTLLYVLTMTPFILFCLVGFSVADFKGDVLLRRAKIDPMAPSSDFGLFLSVLVWATHGYEYSGALAGSLNDPPRTYPRVIAAAVCVVTLTYMLPLVCQ